MLILDLWGISFHAVVVFGLGKNLLFKSILGRCDTRGKLGQKLSLCCTLSALLPTISNEFWKVFWVTLIGHLGPLMTCSEFRYIPIDNTFQVPTLRHMCTLYILCSKAASK